MENFVRVIIKEEDGREFKTFINMNHVSAIKIRDDAIYIHIKNEVIDVSDPESIKAIKNYLFI